jgi:hypothetical protein
MLRAAGILVVLFTAVACASAAKGKRCAPIDPELYLDYGGLYDECSVEQRAHLSFAPRIDYQYSAPPNVYCLYGSLRFIIDTLGKPLPQTVEVTAANDERYIELMVNYLPQVRFTPGRVKKRPVHQIVRWESRTAVRLPVSTSRTATTRTVSC